MRPGSWRRRSLATRNNRPVHRHVAGRQGRGAATCNVMQLQSHCNAALCARLVHRPHVGRRAEPSGLCHCACAACREEANAMQCAARITSCLKPALSLSCVRTLYTLKWAFGHYPCCPHPAARYGHDSYEAWAPAPAARPPTCWPTPTPPPQFHSGCILCVLLLCCPIELDLATSSHTKTKNNLGLHPPAVAEHLLVPASRSPPPPSTHTRTAIKRRLGLLLLQLLQLLLLFNHHLGHQPLVIRGRVVVVADGLPTQQQQPTGQQRYTR